MQMKPDQPQGSALGAVAENAASIDSRALLTIPAGLVGLGRTLYGSATGESPDVADSAGGEAVRQMLSLGYTPKTVQGQAVQSAIAAPFVKGGDVALEYGGPKAKLAFDVASQLAPVGKVFGAKAVGAATKSAAAAEAKSAMLDTVSKDVPLESQINQASQDLVSNLGGSSSAQYDAALKKSNTDRIESIKSAEGPKYDQVRAAISNKYTVPGETYQYLQDRLKQVGGNVDALSAGEKKLKTTLENNPTFVSVGGQPQAMVTYGVIDSLRKQFGKKYSNDPEFATADTAQRDAIYGALSRDQTTAAKAAGVGDVLDQAHVLTKARKAIETSHYALFDKDAVGSAVPKIEAAARGLQAGDMSKYEDFVSNTPTRREGAVQVLQTLMHPGNDAIGPKVIDVLKGMDPAARKQFIMDLPPEALARAQTIAESAATPMPKSGNLLGEAYQQAKSRTLPVVAAEALGSMAGVPGLVTAGITAAALKKAASVHHNALLAAAKAKQAAR
jgi:hypothetical protein